MHKSAPMLWGRLYYYCVWHVVNFIATFYTLQKLQRPVNCPYVQPLLHLRSRSSRSCNASLSTSPSGRRPASIPWSLPISPVLRRKRDAYSFRLLFCCFSISIVAIMAASPAVVRNKLRLFGPGECCHSTTGRRLIPQGFFIRPCPVGFQDMARLSVCILFTGTTGQQNATQDRPVLSSQTSLMFALVRVMAHLPGQRRRNIASISWRVLRVIPMRRV
jgi:hypothetical protein